MSEKLTQEKYEEQVVDLAKKGMTNEKIGLVIKKEHKITPRSYEKISKVLKRHNIYPDPDMANLKKSVQILEKHAQSHKQDQTFKRALFVKSAKLRKYQGPRQESSAKFHKKLKPIATAEWDSSV